MVTNTNTFTTRDGHEDTAILKEWKQVTQ